MSDLAVERPDDLDLSQAWGRVVEEVEQRRWRVWATVLIAAGLLPVL